MVAFSKLFMDREGWNWTWPLLVSQESIFSHFSFLRWGVVQWLIKGGPWSCYTCFIRPHSSDPGCASRPLCNDAGIFQWTQISLRWRTEVSETEDLSSLWNFLSSSHAHRCSSWPLVHPSLLPATIGEDTTAHERRPYGSPRTETDLTFPCNNMWNMPKELKPDGDRGDPRPKSLDFIPSKTWHMGIWEPLWKRLCLIVRLLAWKCHED